MCGAGLWLVVAWERDVVHVVVDADEPLLVVVVQCKVGVVRVGDLGGKVGQVGYRGTIQQPGVCGPTRTCG